MPSDSDSQSHSAQSSASPTPQRPARFEQWLAQREFEEPVVPAPADDEAPPSPPPPQRRRRQQYTCGECPAEMPTRIEMKCSMEEDLTATHIEDYNEGDAVHTTPPNPILPVSI